MDIDMADETRDTADVADPPRDDQATPRPDDGEEPTGGAEGEERALAALAAPQTMDMRQDVDDDDDDEELPFPGFVPVALRCLDQKNFIRLWCLRTITWPYPFC